MTKVTYLLLNSAFVYKKFSCLFWLQNQLIILITKIMSAVCLLKVSCVSANVQLFVYKCQLIHSKVHLEVYWGNLGAINEHLFGLLSFSIVQLALTTHAANVWNVHQVSVSCIMNKEFPFYGYRWNWLMIEMGYDENRFNFPMNKEDSTSRATASLKLGCFLPANWNITLPNLIPSKRSQKW